MTRKLPPLQLVRSVMKSFIKESGLEPRLLGPHFRVTDAVAGKVDFELDIAKDHTNRLKILHGGTIASMVDLGGSLAVASMGLYATGVSTDLNVTYLSSGGKVGDKISGTAICDMMGRRLAYTSVTFRNAAGELAARGSHTKYVANAWKEQESLFVPPDGAEIDEDD
ncbi:Thioesterase/thiol ester dehydrase-isomerase [Annulohypoxylon maeteangense]|uniref:Thioesterase/thiol ester dehydrase-isomerase n=1 Tax=Annulohypoxylon maeteangense TaxID=1927788 RepID=UPI00200812B0|nr:Thioesterase/thiol ester dehydrase-isomerase [Annulohypoxylon maeteangense]KAI0879995.1 Thioesterase/thiol ester dehydrase-isomerase [Annulohypoxylon maeteangense]